MARHPMRFLTFALLLTFTLAYKSGAPAEVCEDMIPQHGVDPQKLPAPYTLSVDKTKIKPGDKVVVTLTPNSALDSFKGFFLQARDNKENIVGTFDKAAETKLVNCKNGKNNAITHSSDKQKKKIVVFWTSPRDLKTPLAFRLTVARNGGEFWVGHKSVTINVTR